MRNFLSSIALVLLGITTSCGDQNQSAPRAVSGGNSTSTASGRVEAKPTGPASIRKFDISLDNIKDAAVSLDRNIYIVQDFSGSMDEDCNGQKKSVTAVQALDEFVKAVPAEVNLGLFMFDGTASERVPLGKNNRAAILKEIRTTGRHSGTPLASSIMKGVDALVVQYQKQLGYGEFRLVVVTDGANNEWTSLDAAIKYANDRGIPIYTIGLCIDGGHELYKSSVWHCEAKSKQELVAGLKSTVAELEVFDATDFHK